MARRMCGYLYKNHEYLTDCGSKFLFRPSVRCEKCGRKPYDKERKDDPSIDRTSNRTA